jgi:hypothetical protein
MLRHQSQAVAIALLVGVSIVCAGSWPGVAQPAAATAPAPDTISGVVTSTKGPEAGVWVVAETKDFPTKLVKIVVTDDQGRYLLPQMPKAHYQLFVRGYGLVDSKRVAAAPGQQVNLHAVIAPNAQAAAQYYPAAWWLSTLKVPSDPAAQKEFVLTVKECHDCHQLGDIATREIAPQILKGTKTSLEAWDKRTAIGPASGSMNPFFESLGDDRKRFSDWSDAIGKGLIPPHAPPRPTGIERNIVLTEWDWSKERWGRTDMEASNPRDPHVNANGPVYGVSEMTDGLLVVDPNKNTAEHIHVPSPAPPNDNPFNANRTPDPWFGPNVWVRHADPRSTLVLPDGRVLVTDRIRPGDNGSGLGGNTTGKQPDFCGKNSTNAFGNYFPLKQSGKQVAIFDPKTRKFEFINTCFSADHNVIDKDDFIYFGQTDAIGWIDLKMWDKTHDPAKSQGWCPAVVDTNGDGKISTGWTEPGEKADPARDQRVAFGAYGVTWNPKDGSLWASGIGRGDRKLVRIIKGAHPPETCRAEIFTPPDDAVFGSGGVMATTDGLVWQNWRVSGHFTSFDPSKCNGESRDPTGKDCRQGWTIYNNPAEPRYVGGSPFKADESYLTEVDEHNTLGLGEAPLYFQTNTDSLEVLRPDTKKFVTIRIPYPMGYFGRSANGRIDDASAGWKGKGLWTAYSSYAGWHVEGPGYPKTGPTGGVGQLGKVVKIQMRPNPLAH